MDFDHLNHLAYDPYEDIQHANNFSDASFMPSKNKLATRKSSMSSQFSRDQAGADHQSDLNLHPLMSSPQAEEYPKMHFQRSDTMDSQSHPYRQCSPNFGQGAQGHQKAVSRPRKLTFGDEEEAQFIDQFDAYVSTTQQSFAGVNAELGSSPFENKTYALTMKIKFQTEYGQSLCVVGSIPELGAWKEYKCHLKWTANHVWVTEHPIVTRQPYFNYKYVLMENGKAKKWERGIDRIADLRLVASQSQGFGSFASNSPSMMKTLSPDHTPIEILDEWESFDLKISIFHPTASDQDSVYIDGAHFGSQRVLMERAFYPVDWLVEKYGQPVQPWLYTLRCDNITGDRCGQWKKTAELKSMQYRFAVSSHHYGTEWERDPPRSISLANPEHYSGQVGHNRTPYQQNPEQIFVINGSAQVSHGNFVGDFEVNQVLGQNVFVGNFPSNERHMSQLASKGITAILDVSPDTSQRSTSVSMGSSKIKIQKRHPIRDGLSFYEDLFQGAVLLNDLIQNKKQSVFVHCTSGVSRAPALVLCYLSLFVRVRDFNNLPALDGMLKSAHSLSFPNLKAVAKVIQTNREFQLKQLKIREEDIASQRRLEEETDRLEQLKAAQEEAERIRMQKLAEQEQADRLRREREEFERQMYEQEERQRRELEELERQRKEEERLRLEQQQREEEERERQRLEAERQEQLRLEQERIERERRRQEEEARLKAEIEAQKEAERLRQIKLEEERARLRKLEEEELKKREEAEALRLQKIREFEEAKRQEELERLRQLQEQERINIERQLKLQKEKEEAEKKRRLEEKKAQERMFASTKQIEEERAIQKKEQDELQRLLELQKRQLVQQVDPEEEETTLVQVPEEQEEIEPTMLTANALDPSPCAFGDPDLLGMTEQEVDDHCDDLFEETPIKFIPRRGNAVDEYIARVIDELKITIPILHIKGSLYLIGATKANCEMKRNFVLIRTGGGYEKFEEYVPNNHRFFQRQLLVQIIKSGESLEWVVNQILKGRKINQVSQAVQPKQEVQTPGPGHYEQPSKSPVRMKANPERMSAIAKKVTINIHNEMSRNASNSRISSTSSERKRISFRDTVKPYSMQVNRPSLRAKLGSPVRQQIVAPASNQQQALSPGPFDRVQKIYYQSSQPSVGSATGSNNSSPTRNMVTRKHNFVNNSQTVMTFQQQNPSIEVIDQREQVGVRHSHQFTSSQRPSAIEPYVRRQKRINQILEQSSPQRKRSPRASLPNQQHQQQTTEAYDQMKKNIFSRSSRSGSPVKSPARAAGSGIGKGLSQLKK